jgi:solute carrier family 13 (sodium-dependent dicarboxylate transporter), member 2/3/5
VSESSVATTAFAASSPDDAEKGRRRRIAAGRVLAVVVPVAVWLAPLRLAPGSKHALAITAFMIVAWVSEAMDHGLAGLIGCYLFWALHVTRIEVAFSGFVSDTPWFSVAAMLIGIMATKSGLARRLGYMVVMRTGVSYSRILLGLILSTFLLTFLVPSGMARVVIVAALALSLLETFGLGPGSNIGCGMFLILTYTSSVFDKTVIAGAAAITARGVMEKIGGVEVLWSRWLLAFLPIQIITIVFAWRLTLWLYPPETSSLPGGMQFLRGELRKLGAWKLPEKKALALMLAAIALWMTDFLHHIPPSTIGLGAGLVALLPVIGVLDANDFKKVNFLLAFIFVGSAVSMGEVLKATGSLDALTRVLFSWMQPLMGNPWLSSFALYWTGFIYHIFLGSEISMLGASMPSLMTMAHEHGWNALAVGMIWTFSAGGKIFVYQSTVLIAGYAYGYFRPRDLLRLGLCMSVLDSIQLLVFVPIYWPLIGIGPVSLGH